MAALVPARRAWVLRAPLNALQVPLPGASVRSRLSLVDFLCLRRFTSGYTGSATTVTCQVVVGD